PLAALHAAPVGGGVRRAGAHSGSLSRSAGSAVSFLQLRRCHVSPLTAPLEPRLLFQVTARDPGCLARCGLLQTSHGSVLTPAFMPVGTQASVKAVDPRDLWELGYRLVLASVSPLA